MTHPTKLESNLHDATEQLVHTAHHEAAHAVIMVLSGFELDYVSIEPEPAEVEGVDGARGAANPRLTDALMGLQNRLNKPGPFEPEPNDLSMIESLVLCRLAGPAADVRHLGREDIGARDDRRQAHRFLERAGLSRELDRIDADARLAVQRAWREIEAVAAELLRTRRLDEGMVRATIRRASGDGRLGTTCQLPDALRPKQDPIGVASEGGEQPPMRRGRAS